MKIFWKRALAVFLCVTLIAGFMPLKAKATEESLVFNAGEEITVSVTGVYGQTEARSMLEMVNDFRANDPTYWNLADTEIINVGPLSSLTYDYTLEAAAMQRAMEIALSWDHARPYSTDTLSCFDVDDEFSVPAEIRGENIAAGYYSAAAAFEGWQEADKSYSGQGHRRNMLNSNFNTIGIAHVVVYGTHFWVQELAYIPENSINHQDPGASDGEESRTMRVMADTLTTISSELSQTTFNLETNVAALPPYISMVGRKNNTWPSNDYIMFSSYPTNWTSSDESVAVYMNDHIVTYNAGTAVFTTTFGGKEFAFTVRVKELLSITNQPASVTAWTGTTVKFSVTATGTGLSYQWQYKKPGTTSWANSTFTGAKTATMSVPVIAARDGYQYRCLIKDVDGEKVYSSAAKLTAKKPITTQPSDVTAAVGDTAKFTVKASGSGLSYQWQYKKAGGSTWYNSSFTGAKTATMSVPVIAARDGYEYRCVVKDSNGNKATSSSAKLTVKIKVASQPQSVTAAIGDTANYSVSATGVGLAYQWQYKKPGTTSWVNSTFTGAKTATMSVPVIAARNGYEYRCVITDANGNTVNSSAAMLTVEIHITKQPQSVTAAAGSTVNFSVRATGAGLTYQWQYKRPGTDKWYKSSFTGAQTNTMTVPVIAARDGYQYRCVITDANGETVNSQEATLNVE